MSLILLFLIALMGITLRLVIRSRKIDSILAWSIIFYCLMWIITPGLSILLLDAFAKEYGSVLTSDFVEFYALESLMVSGVIMVFLRSKLRNQPEKVGPIVRKKTFFPLAVIYFFWIIQNILTQSTDYQANNDLSLAVASNSAGVFTLLYALLGAFFTYIALKAQKGLILYVSLGLILLSVVQSVLTGSRIPMMWPLFIFIFRFWGPIKASLFARSVRRRIIIVVAVPVIFLGIMAMSALIGSTRSKQSLLDVEWDFESFNSIVLIQNLYSKFNSFSTGIQLINGYGSGTAGYKPYIGSLFYFVPRFIYPNKPIAGSVDDTYFGTPARLVPALDNPNDTINNRGVSPLAISIWHWGWIGGMFAFLLGGLITLRLLNYLLNSNLLFFKTMGIFLIPIPIFINVFPSPDVALKHASLIGLILFLTMFGKILLRNMPRRKIGSVSDAVSVVKH